MVTGVLACPCHLPITLPIVAVLAGGTGLGALLVENPAVVAVVLAIYFVSAIGAGWWLLQRKAATLAHDAGSCEPSAVGRLPPSLAADSNGREVT